MPPQPHPATDGPSPRPRGLSERVRALLGLDDDTAVVIREFRYTEPGRPPRRTVVAVLPMDGEAHRWTLHRPPDQITDQALRAALLHQPPA